MDQKKEQITAAFNSVKARAQAYAAASCHDRFQQQLAAISLWAPHWWPNWGNYLPWPKPRVVISRSAAQRGPKALEFLVAHELGHAADEVIHLLLAAAIVGSIASFSLAAALSEKSHLLSWLAFLFPFAAAIPFRRLRGWKCRERTADEYAIRILGLPAFLDGEMALRRKNFKHFTTKQQNDLLAVISDVGNPRSA